MVNFFQLDRAGAEDGCRVTHEGMRIAHEAGLEAESVAINDEHAEPDQPT
jgi:hypothetical protein